MEDEGVRELFNKFKIGIIIIIIFLIPVLFIFINGFGRENNKIINKINNKETFYLLIFDNKTNNKGIDKILNNNNVLYEKYNTDKTRYYDELLNKLKINEDDIIKPTLIYIKDGKLYSSLVDINDENILLSFIDSNLKYSE